nr:hypothetical protein [Tanacetum cinerariifolium]
MGFEARAIEEMLLHKMGTGTHLLPMGVLPGGNGTSIHELFFSKASNSNFIASTHFECLDACMCLVLVDFLCNGGCRGGGGGCGVGVGVASAESVVDGVWDVEVFGVDVFELEVDCVGVNMVGERRRMV